MSKLTQIPLDFGQEQPSTPTPPPGGNASGGDPTGQYLAADGVGVRIKSYKRAPEALPDYNPTRVVNGDLFGAEDNGAGMQSGTDEVGTPAAEPSQPGPVVRTVRKSKTAPKKGPSKRGRKSLKQVAAEADLIDIPADEVLFSKQYYTMGEVSEMFRVNQSLLRFWETEFDILQPRKNKKGDRYFRPIDIKNLHLIYHLLRQKKYTIEGAKEFLKKNKKAEERFEVIRRLQEIKAFLLEWKAQL